MYIISCKVCNSEISIYTKVHNGDRNINWGYFEFERILLFMKFTTKTFTFCMIVGFIILNGLTGVVRADELDIDLSYQDAKKMAWMQVDSVIEGGQEVGMWSKNMKATKCQKLYDCYDNVTAYCVSFTNEAGEPCGYVVVGADENVAPIVEFATEGEFFSTTNEKVFYFGEYDYYVNDEKVGQLENISNNSPNEDNNISKREAKKIKIDGDYEKEWEFFEDNYLDSSKNKVSIEAKGNSIKKQTITKNEAKKIITDPFDIEDDWISVAPIDSEKYNLKYFTTSDFKGESNCSPTAGVNLMLYWNTKGPDKYASLKYKNSWKSTYSKLYSYMKTDKDGTYDKDIRDGIKKYLDLCGFKKSVVKLNTSPDFYDVVYELDNGGASRPFIFGVEDHGTYGEHSLLAIGYMEFEYKTKQKVLNGRYSRYLRVADGWSSSSDRFVHFDLGHNSKERSMVTVKIKK